MHSYTIHTVDNSPCTDIINSLLVRKVLRIGTVRYNWPMSAHASTAFSIAHCTDSEDLPLVKLYGV